MISAIARPRSLDWATEESAGTRLLFVALAGALLFHGGLLPFTHGNTYDAYIHMFFADSYHRSWFDQWEPRWYTGFATTSYPPGTHMAIAGLMYFLPLRAAFIVAQLTGLLLLTVGVFRFSLLWVTPRPAGLAAIALVLSSSVSETIHLFGQLPTIFSLGVFLNGMPYVYRWITIGSMRDFGVAIIFTSATTAAHHVTTIFGSVLFVIPLGLQALRAVAEMYPTDSRRFKVQRFLKPLGRGILLAVCMGGAMAITVLAYWIWSINDPITQVPIPHGSRENFLERLDLGLVFFLLPWGLALAFLPYVVLKTATTRLWPLGLSVMLCFVLGTGGTTPISRALLGGAFEILTLDRFTFWATILILPFIGHLFDGLLFGRSGQVVRAAFGHGVQRLLIGGMFLSMTLIAVFAAILPTIQPTQPKFIDPTPITQFLASDEHNKWRYLTLGFGDQFAYLSAMTDARSIDGNYHSARRLPDMTRFSVERLENAKYLGVPGLGSLRQFLVNADNYHLKYVFSNDAFYDPLLHFTGWTRLNRLINGVTVWEKGDVSPLPVFERRRDIPHFQMVMWGLLPPSALSLAGLIFLLSVLRRNFGHSAKDVRPLVARKTAFTNIKRTRKLVFLLGLTTLAFASVLTGFILNKLNNPLGPEKVVEGYFDNLDFRQFQAAYDKIDPVTRPRFDEVMFNWRWRGGLVASYGKLNDQTLTITDRVQNIIDWQVDLHWLTALGYRDQTVHIRTVKRDGRWFIAPTTLRPTQTPVRLQRRETVSWNVVGRRQPRIETDLHRDRMDRPQITANSARLIEYQERFYVVGSITNTDADPASVSLFSDLLSEGTSLMRQAAAEVAGQRLLPAETSGFRIGFQGVLSLEDEERNGSFDPEIYIPPELDARPDGASLEARALVAGRDLYRGVSLNGVRVTETNGGVSINGTAANTGTETATIIRITALVMDDGGQPIWVESGFVETNIYPGQSAPFHFTWPKRDALRVLDDIAPKNIVVNGSNATKPINASPKFSTIPLSNIDGYSAIHLSVSSMTFDPLF